MPLGLWSSNVSYWSLQLCYSFPPHFNVSILNLKRPLYGRLCSSLASPASFKCLASSRRKTSDLPLTQLECLLPALAFQKTSQTGLNWNCADPYGADPQDRPSHCMHGPGWGWRKIQATSTSCILLHAPSVFAARASHVQAYFNYSACSHSLITNRKISLAFTSRNRSGCKSTLISQFCNFFTYCMMIRYCWYISSWVLK